MNLYEKLHQHKNVFRQSSGATGNTSMWTIPMFDEDLCQQTCPVELRSFMEKQEDFHESTFSSGLVVDDHFY